MSHFDPHIDGIERDAAAAAAQVAVRTHYRSASASNHDNNNNNDNLHQQQHQQQQQHRPPSSTMNQRRSISDSRLHTPYLHAASSFGSISRFAAYREIRQDEKKEFTRRQGWENYDPSSWRTWGNSTVASGGGVGVGSSGGGLSGGRIDEEEAVVGVVATDESAGGDVGGLSGEAGASAGGGGDAGGQVATTTTETSPLLGKSILRFSSVSTTTSPQGDRQLSELSPDKQRSSQQQQQQHGVVVLNDGDPYIALKEMFTDSKINILFLFLPLAIYSHYSTSLHFTDGSIFIINFLAMIPLASMLGVFTEELAAHTNDVIGGLINATFGNAVELVVAIQALLAEDYRVVQASLVGSVFSNLLLVLGMCFFCGGMKYPEQEFIGQGAVASIALLGLNGLALLLPAQFNVGDGVNDEAETDDLTTISRIGSLLLVMMYALLLFFQLKTHVYLFEGDDDVVALIPFHWALIGLVVITAIVTILSEYLVASIDGFCEEFHLGRSFVGVIILPVVGNAVEHISAVSVAMKNKMDLALGVALGSAVQIGLFVLPAVVVIGWATGKEMTLKFPSYEVYLYLMSVVIVSLCLTNQRSNWLEGALLVSTYAMIAVGIYFEDDIVSET